jgi:cob(I)alamin adenosyltransferase
MKKEKCRVVLLTGDGKGKTTSALGMVLRGVGHGQRICVVQFIKEKRDSSEVLALGEFHFVEVHVCGAGFVLPKSKKTLKVHQQAALDGWAIAKKNLLSAPDIDMVVLDEICGAVEFGLLDEDEVCETIRAAPPRKIVILTGRNASPKLLDLADTISRIECEKHGYKSGYSAWPGVEF